MENANVVWLHLRVTTKCTTNGDHYTWRRQNKTTPMPNHHLRLH